MNVFGLDEELPQLSKFLDLDVGYQASALFITHMRIHKCTKGYYFEVFRTTYTYATSIITLTYVHIWGTSRKHTTFVLVW